MEEIRVYLVDFYNYNLGDGVYDWDDERFISEAEKQGTVYTIVGFQYAYNEGDINGENSYIRII